MNIAQCCQEIVDRYGFGKNAAPGPVAWTSGSRDSGQSLRSKWLPRVERDPNSSNGFHSVLLFWAASLRAGRLPSIGQLTAEH